MAELNARFSLEQKQIKAYFNLERTTIPAIFKINATPTKVSQLENDLNFQSKEQVEESINNALVPVNERIDEIEEKISDIDIQGSALIDVVKIGDSKTIFSKSFVFEQGIVSDTWVINHDLNKRPSIELVDSSGRKFEAEVEYINENQIVVRLNSATTGYAYLN